MEREKEKEEIKEFNDINKNLKELKEKINYSKDIYDGINIKIKLINKEIKNYELKNKNYINKIKEINDLNNLILIKKQMVDEMNLKLEKLDEEIKNVKLSLNNQNNNNNNLNQNDKYNTNIIFNGIDEIIQEINDNKNLENENQTRVVSEKQSDEEGKENKENFANFVFSVNHKFDDKNSKNFGIESLTKRKPFGEFNFE